MSADSIQLNQRLPTDGSEGDYAALLDRPGVDVDAAPNAGVCGALGCHDREHLVRVRLEEIGQRVVCPSHAAGLLRRELEER